MAVTCCFSGRLGNIIFHLSMLLAYCKKHDLQYFIPNEADAYLGFHGNNKPPQFNIQSTGLKPVSPIVCRESDMGYPAYHDIKKMDNVLFDGYFQSFKYFDWCRDYILSVFNFPDKPEDGMTSVSVRRGDCVNSPTFPMCPIEYYQNGIKYMQKMGLNKFRVYSDDIKWCKDVFTQENFPNALIEFSEGGNEMDDYISILNCANQITARSTFSLTAAWFNRNPKKIVCVPTTKFKWWNNMNQNLLTDTGFIEIDFSKISDELEIEKINETMQVVQHAVRTERAEKINPTIWRS